MRRQFAPKRCVALVAALVTCLLHLVHARLTFEGFPDGQTVAPNGVDYIQETPTALSASQVTPSSDAPFFTLDHQACENAHPQIVRGDHGDIGIINTISAANLSKVSSARTHMSIVLFHGGPACKHSRALLPTWVKLTRRMRASCLLAVDAAADSMMNYNLMVVGFPTIMRASPETSATYRGGRSLQDLIAWSVKVGANAPMSIEAMDHLDADLRRFHHQLDHDVHEGHLDVLDISEGAGKKTGVNWTLVAANVVTAVYFAWQLRNTHRVLTSVRKRRAAHAHRTHH